jgi:AbrB family looped-hinge helix DNA binding protein
MQGFDMGCTENMEACFYGSVTVGERGQVVIPAEARNEMGIKPGDKLLIMKHPVYRGLMVAKLDALRGFLDEFAREVERMDSVEPVMEAVE